MNWRAPIWIVVMALVPAGVSKASPAPAPVERALNPSEFSEHLAEQAGADHRVAWKEPGIARLQAPMQDLVAEVDRLGLSLISDSKDEPGRLRLQPSRVGRGTQRYPMGAGQVSLQGPLVRLSRPGLIEEFSTSSQGIRQDFLLPERLPGSAPLRLELHLEGATAELHDDGVRLRLEASDRELDYGRLLITDATGQVLSGHFEVMGENRLVINVLDDAARYPIRIDPTFTDSQWQAIAAPFAEGTNDNIFALAWDSANGHLYAGGDFTTAAGVAANRVARWDGSQWERLSGGVNNTVLALTWDSANGHLYAGGTFSTANGVAVNGIARWDGTNWTALGSGMTTGQVWALAWDSTNGHLYAGGPFTTAGGIPADRVARWDGSAWSALGTGVNDPVLALAWDAANGHLYAGGRFFRAGGIIADSIARWDGSAWSALGLGTNNEVRVLAWDAVNGHLYAGGVFTSAGGAPADRVARWDGSTWSGLGLGVDSFVFSLAWDAANGHLYVGGDFTTAGGAPASRMARWDGAAWSALGAGMNDFVRALAWDGASGDLYAGGFFTNAGGLARNRVARWDGSAWSALGSGVSDEVRALAWDGANGHLYAGTTFINADGIVFSHIIRWDGSAWSALGSGMDSSVLALAWDGVHGHLYAGGEFTTAGGVPASRIARWDGSTWSALGLGVNDEVRDLAWDGASGDLYAGGTFTTAGGAPANRIARWDGSTWSPLGSGINGAVNALAWDGANGHLYTGGIFTVAGGVPAFSVARWDGSAWSSLVFGTGGGVNALAWDGANGHLYVGGSFTVPGVLGADHIALWDGSAWSALGVGTNALVTALAWDGTNEHLFAGGAFDNAGGVAANDIACWDGTAWVPLGSGTNPSAPLDLVWDGANGHLYAGGNFTSAGNQPARVARANLGVAFATATDGTGNGNTVGSTADGAYFEGTTITLVATPDADSDFTGWSPATCVDGFSLEDPTTCTAMFTLKTYSFATATAGTGSGATAGSTPNGTYDHGTPITLVATPAPGSNFTGWSPAACVDGFSLEADTTCAATFTLSTYAFATTTTGTGSGNTTGSTADGTYDHGTAMTLVATPDAGSDFAGWSPASCIDGFSLEADSTCTAEFTLRTHTFATATAGTGNGSTAGSTADGTYDHGTVITLVATPDVGSDFAGWSPATCVDGFSLEADTTCTATFTLRTYPINTTVSPIGSGTVSCSPNPVSHGANASCTATANVGFVFDQFSGDCTGFDCDLINVTSERNVTAEFFVEDFDGVPAPIEHAGPNFGDGNDDGIPDAEQSDVASLPAAEGGGYLTLVVSGACSQLHEVQTSMVATPDAAGYRYPLGMLGFTLPCESATVTVLYHGVEGLAGFNYRKLGSHPPGSGSELWYSMPGAVFGTTIVFGQTVATATFDLADNAIGDATGDDGQIVDPGGPGLLLIGIPTLDPFGLVVLSLLLGAAGILIQRR